MRGVSHLIAVVRVTLGERSGKLWARDAASRDNARECARRTRIGPCGNAMTRLRMDVDGGRATSRWATLSPRGG